MAQALQHLRLELDRFPEALRKHVDPASPPPMRMMAARAMVPMGPRELVSVLYQLTLDPEQKIRESAQKSLEELPPDMIDGVIRQDLDPMVLDLLAVTNLERDDRLEIIVTNHALSDLSMAYLAQHVSERIAEIIGGIHVRLLRHPAIIEALYLNPRTRMSTVDKVLDLARRNNVEFSGLPALNDALASADYYNKGQAESELSDEEFARLAYESTASDDDAETERIEALLEGEDQAKTPEEERRMSRWQLLERMNAAQKIRLALLGNREDRFVLLRDSRKVVHMAAIKSPKIGPGEAAQIAASRNLPDGVIHHVAKARDWVRYYPVMLALVNNPKCPLADSMAFLKQLRPNDLKTLQRNKNVPTQLARQAQVIARQKESVRG
ncbi:MAG: hypothetical protein RBU37_04515 [Myxococcota bacterium]|jgi:hypothetical protein|nr:hypothetical protein [Myxococcota bacterium]